MQKNSLFSLFPRLLLCFSFFLLVGCETLSGTGQDTILSAKIPEKCRDRFALSGRISVNYTLSGKEERQSLHGKFTWTRNSEETHIRLFSPLGQTLAVIDVSPGRAVFSAPGKPPVEAKSADELLFNQLGWPLPVSGIQDWLQGCAVNEKGKPARASPARPEITTKDGWNIRYIGWQTFRENELTPWRIDMTHIPLTDAAISNIHIRLVIGGWDEEN